jgi:DNA-binding Xre family transcriptional regulator
MANIRLEKTDGHFQKMLKNEEFRRQYEIERAKVALAQKIAEMRQEKHINQKELAARLGVSQQFVSQIETGNGKNLTLDTIIRIAKSLGHRVCISFPKSVADKAQLEVA